MTGHEPDENEMALQVALKSRGVGLIGGGGPDDVQAPPPPPPAEPPTVHLRTAPAAPAAPGNRIPDWRTGQHVVLPFKDDDQDERKEEPVTWHGAHRRPQASAPVDKRDDTSAGRIEDDPRFRLLRRIKNGPAADGEQHVDKVDPDHEAVEGPAVEQQPAAAKVRRLDVRRLARSSAITDQERDKRRLRRIAFTGTAAALGSWFGLVPVFGQYLPAAEQSVTPVFATALAAVGGYAGWKLTGADAVRTVCSHPVFRLIGTAGLAELGRRLAPIPVQWLNERGARYGLGPDSTSLLIVAVVMCGGLAWGIDRRARHLHWTGRLFCHIPTASALLAVGLYAPGTAH
ncbi:hypothetical protein SUDANB1_05621 [Streptomyces sp. enrichment culture]|uniref:hypothetical protein n=1 Tax=Streptomyces sp. enrichment culture TaxID=1795815 RepID=UPI003F575D82